LRVPTLQERLSDIPLLAENILQKLANEQHKPTLNLSAACLQALQAYSFPGNVRELENILERAITLCNDNTIEVDDLHLPQANPQPLASMPSAEKFDLDETLQEHEKKLILNALEKTKWNRTAAARLLGVSFRTLRYRLKKLGLD